MSATSKRIVLCLLALVLPALTNDLTSQEATTTGIPDAHKTTVDRFTCFVPIDAAGNSDADANSMPAMKLDQMTPDQMTPDQALSPAMDAWTNYSRLWKAVHDHPSDETLLRYFGLNASETKVRRGRSAPRWLAWKSGSYAKIDTPHFTIYSRSDRGSSMKVAEKLEQCYWVWTQMFFPLWEASKQVSSHLDALAKTSEQSSQSVIDLLKKSRRRITIRRRMQIVLLSDSNQYVETLGKDNPGIEQSTGFYSDDRQTTFLFADPLDLPTLRHELVHQLFRQATNSRLGKAMPGEQRDFWLIEGIAGYFESMADNSLGSATIGGWDSPRLQYARYRVLAGGDHMDSDELRRDGRLAAQHRDDLSRWYAHAIATTHLLLDGGDAASRLWVYQKLAQLYKIETDLGEAAREFPNDATLQSFLRIDDDHLQNNPATRSLEQICLTRCNLTDVGLASLPPSPDLRWLDLSHLPADHKLLQQLLPKPSKLQQLSLEATSVGDEISNWISGADQLRELDLSWTKIGDPTMKSFATAKQLDTVWITGSTVTNGSIDVLSGLPRLNNLDVQRTKITEEGLKRLRLKRPPLNLNSLQLRPAVP